MTSDRKDSHFLKWPRKNTDFHKNVDIGKSLKNTQLLEQREQVKIKGRIAPFQTTTPNWVAQK